MHRRANGHGSESKQTAKDGTATFHGCRRASKLRWRRGFCEPRQPATVAAVIGTVNDLLETMWVLVDPFPSLPGVGRHGGGMLPPSPMFNRHYTTPGRCGFLSFPVPPPGGPECRS